MTYTAIAFETRLPGLTIEQFAHHYDNVHVPLIKECVGDAFPVSHSRYYVRHYPAEEGADPKETTPKMIFYGTEVDVPYDCLVMMVFEDIPHFMRFKEAYEQSPRKKDLDDDEDLFMIKSKMVALAVEEPHVRKQFDPLPEGFKWERK